MGNRKRFIAAAIIGAAILSIVIAGFRAGLSRDSGAPGRHSAGDVIGLIYIEGGIAGGRNSPGLTGTSRGSDYIVEQIRDAGDDPSVKALVIRLNTPGGAAAASQEIAREITRLRRSGKKVVASIGDVCASGGYWVAASADLIIANPATITGSIGVIMEVAQIEQLMDKIGVEIEVIKSGPLKDIGSSTRKLDEEERALLQEMVDDIHAQFVEQVAQGRRIEPERVRGIADGRVFTGRQAKDLGLVDEFGNLEDAINAAGRLAGLREGWSVRDYSRQTLLEHFRDLIEAGISLDGILGIPAGLPVGPGRLGSVDLVRFR